MNYVMRNIGRTLICVSMAPIILVMTGCATSGIKHLDQSYMDRIKATSENVCLVESQFRIEGKANPARAFLGPSSNGQLGRSSH